ncbi:MAG TPA: PEP-CTERM sorting domain-containing protein [Myxococcota bacterium]|nr:PEP-CTERM sorting domain-containing protein [Myxococcota bacterium]
MALSFGARHSLAMAVTDPAGDFISTYTGPHNGDVDVLSSEVIYDPTAATFTFEATFAAPVNTSPGALYVWGVNRGTGTQLLQGGTPPVGAGVIFDSVFIGVPGNGSGIVNLLDGSAATTLPGVLQISGDSVSATIAASLLPSTGLPLSQYEWNLWPRVGSATNADISDFAPDATVVLVTVAPEPASLVLVAGALALLTAVRRRA